MIVVDSQAPAWAHDLARKAERYVLGALSQPVRLPSYVVADLPSVTRFVNCAIIVSDETGGRTIATSDGTNWRRVSDGAIVA